jgi:hypothetical protein
LRWRRVKLAELLEIMSVVVHFQGITVNLEWVLMHLGSHKRDVGEEPTDRGLKLGWVNQDEMKK